MYLNKMRASANRNTLKQINMVFEVTNLF